MDGVGSPQSLTTEVFGDKKPLTWKDGLRLVDLHELAKQMHCKTCAALLDLNNTQNETRWGFASVLSVLCGYCQTLNDIYTGKVLSETDEGRTVFDVNMKASVHMLLCGTGGEHVINFLAVLNIPEPTPEVIPMVLSPPLDSPGSVPAGRSPEKSASRSSSTSSGMLLQTAKETMSDNAIHDQNTCGRLVVSADSIKKEQSEEPPGTSQANSQQISCPKARSKDDPKARRGRKRKTGGAADSLDSAALAASEAEVEETGGLDGVHFDDMYEEEERRVQKAVPQKQYRCPLCGKILPSSRGFHIHVGRKHQASNLQAVHYELEPDDLTAGDTRQIPVVKDATMLQPSDADHVSPAQSALAEKMTSATVKTSAVSFPSASRSSASLTPPTEGEGKLNAAAESDSDKLDDTVSMEIGRLSQRLTPSQKTGDRKVCGILNCGRTFQTEKLYQKHLQKVHKVESPFTCTQCPKQYSSQKSLNIHMTVAHCSEDERKAVCKYCGDTVQHRRALKKHIKAHHPRGSKRTFYCDECPKTFPLPSALKNHKLRHSGIKNYQCFYCDKRFSGSGNRLNHMRYFHERERKFLCDTCGAGFYRAYALREHERVHSGEKPYQCERCAERFTKKEYLTIHMRTHTGEKPYKCELCDKAFTQRTSRSLHRRKVHGMKKQEPSGSQKQSEMVVNNKVVSISS